MFTPLHDEISSAVAANLLGLSSRQIERMCVRGIFKSAFKPGDGVNAHWRLSRSEVISRKSQKTQQKQVQTV